MIHWLIYAYLALPLIVGLTFALSVRKNVRKPALFTVTAVIEGYMIAAIMVPWAADPLTRMGISGGQGAEAELLGPLEITGLVSLALLLVAHLLGLWLLYRFVRRI
jgi:predicted acyltransferase